MSRRRVPMARTLLATCRHEAAHAVVCKALGGRVSWCQVKGPGKGFMKPDGRRKVGPLSMSVVLMAGTAAEKRLADAYRRETRARLEAQGRPWLRAVANV